MDNTNTTLEANAQQKVDVTAFGMDAQQIRSTGIVRKLDDYGRFVIPKDIRRIFNIKERDSMGEWVEDGMIVLEAYQPENHTIYRQVDDLGRIVLPEELRIQIGVEVRDPLELLVKGNRLFLIKAYPTCVFCGNSENLSAYKNRDLCSSCIAELTEHIESCQHNSRPSLLEKIRAFFS